MMVGQNQQPRAPVSTGMSTQERVDFLNSILQSSTEYSIVAEDLDGTILAWNEGARRVYGYEASDLVGKASAFVLHDPEDVASGRAHAILDVARQTGKWSGELTRVRKDGSRFSAHFTLTLRRDPSGEPVGFTMISHDLSESLAVLRELRESQEYNRRLIESNIDALMTTDPLGIITDVNRRICELTGCSREQLIGTPFKTYFTDPKRAEDGIRKVLAWDQVTNYELVLRSRSGAQTPVSYNATSLRSGDGRLKGVFAAARDITEQKQLESDLRQAQRYTRGLIEASVDALLTVDPQLMITDVNAETQRITGHTREELVGSPFPDYFTDPKRASEGVRKTLAEGVVTDYVLRLRARDGRESLVSFNASVFRDTEGMVRGIFAVARDVTEQRHLEQKLRESQAYTRGLIEASVDALVVVDPDLRITDVNEQMVTLTEFSRKELIGSSFRDYFIDPALAAAGVRQTLARGSVTNCELVLKSRSGKHTLVSFNAAIYKDAAGLVVGIMAAAREITGQRRLEEQLREQQAYSRSLIEASADALMTVDPAGLITDINGQTAKLLGYNIKQIVSSPFARYFTDPERAAAGIRRTFREGVVTNYELMVRAKSGLETPVSLNAAVFKDTAGKGAGIFAVARDVTQQKQIEAALREQQTYTRGLIESNIDALMTTDPLGFITDVNRQMCAISGRARGELIGAPFKGLFTDPKRAEDGIRKVLVEDRVTNYELTLRAKDGKETVVSYNATTFRGADNALRGVFAAARDVTEQKVLEEKIRRQNRELRETTSFLNNVLESSTEYSIIAMDLDEKILAWNEGARRNYGYSADEMVGSRYSRILHAAEDVASGRAKDLLDTALRTGKAEGIFGRIRRNGQRFTASVAVTLRRNAAGAPVGYVLISKDITEQIRLEEQVRRKNEELVRVQEANRLKSEFMANMSHELRTPLNGIIGFAELMLSGKTGPLADVHAEYLGDILASAKHLLQLINDVLDLSKVEAGKSELRPEPVDLAKVVGEVRDILRTLVARKRIDLQMEVAPSLTDIVLDPGKLKQVLYNYLSNALKFTPDEGRVDIRLCPEGPEHLRLEVEDSGIGIRPEDFGRLFVEFQQLDSSMAKKYPGTGLGLALTKRIVESQGGSVGVRSELGRGSTFHAVLPRRGSPAPAPRADFEGRSAAGAPAVLIVEDDAQDRLWLAKMLAGASYDVEVAATGAEAIAKARRRAFDALTLDLLLPDMNGSDVLRAIRAIDASRTIPAIVITVVPELGAAAGFSVSDFIIKPARTPELIAALERAGVAPKAPQRTSAGTAETHS